MTKYHLSCACSRPAHSVILTKDFGERTFQFQLSSWLGFWSRVWMSLKYIFNANKVITWDTVMVEEKEMYALREWMKD